MTVSYDVDFLLTLYFICAVSVAVPESQAAISWLSSVSCEVLEVVPLWYRWGRL